jgi:Domain of unknown function/Domain of unknown function (DUF5126)/Domain of unknown function (DUF4959)
MKKIIKNYVSPIGLILIFVLAISSCSKMETQGPINGKKGRPGPVSNVTVSNFDGGSTLTYTIPEAQAGISASYIMAEYEINKITHKTRQAKSSIYDNKITVDGFNTAGEYTVNLYSVSASEEKSEPVTVVVKPGTPPFRAVKATLKLIADFGGVTTQFENPSKAKVAVSIVTQNSNNEYYPVQTSYTSAESGTVVARGFDSKLRKFGVFVRDGFDNYSDTLWTEVSPLFEQLLDKTKFREYNMPGDNPYDYGWVVSNLWDNNLNTGYHSREGIPMPIRVTFDLGKVVKLSRFKIFQRGNYYEWGNPRKWTMWGSVDPDPSGSYTGWTKLRDCESIKPSRSPLGTVTKEDIAYAAAGEEFVFPLSAPDVRYIRFECLENWSNSGRLHMMELTFWGDR